MHVTLKHPETGEFAELCLATPTPTALIIRRSEHWESVREEVFMMARAHGARSLLDVAGAEAHLCAAGLQDYYWRL